MAKMTKSELLSVVTAEIDSAREISTLQRHREDAMNYYLGEPFGNEIEGRSQVVSTDVQETIEWTMPSLMRIFTSTDKACVFDPSGPEDEAAAQQETELVNHVFYKENNGFLTLYSMFKDALLQKNGIVKFWWDDDKETVREEYTGLNDVELMTLLSDPNVEPLEHDEIFGEMGTVHDVVIHRTNSTGRVKIAPVPPEEFLISADATSVDPSEARFVCHHTLKTRSDLVAMGISRRIVDSLPSYSGQFDSPEKDARDYLDNDYRDYSSHKSTDRVEYDECYIRVDFDGDGIAELRQVSVVGGDRVVENEEVDCIPFAAITPIILTHKFYGMSVADTVMDLQKIRSALLRGILDNTYNANNSRTAIQDGRVNMDDLLTSRPGGVVRTDAPPSQVLMPIPHNPLPAQTFQVLEQTEKMRKERTGVGQDTMGLDANTLAHARTGAVSQSYDMARMRIELIARVFAETGVKQLFRGIHKILLQNQNKPKWFKMRGEWVDVNPAEWRTRSDMSVNVGLGTGNRDKQMQGIMAILAMQEKLLALGAGVTPTNIYNALEKLVEFSGFRDVDQFFTDPSTQPPQPPKQDPQEQLVQAQIELTQAQVDNARMEAETNRQEAKWRHDEKLKELTDKDLRERTKMELEFQRNVPGALV